VTTAGTIPDGGYVYQVIPVEPGATYYASVDATCAGTATAYLEIYDVTNSAVLDSGSFAGLHNGRVRLTVAIPATCESVQYRLGPKAISKVVYYDDAVFTRAADTNVALPTDIIKAGQVLGAYYDAVYDNDTPSEAVMVPYPWYRVVDGEGGLHLLLSPGLYTPVYLDVLHPYAELTSDSDTAFMPREQLELAATIELLDVLRHRAPGQETQQWERLYREANAKYVKQYPRVIPFYHAFANPQ
jgi:hypothetical protein